MRSSSSRTLLRSSSVCTYLPKYLKSRQAKKRRGEEGGCSQFVSKCQKEVRQARNKRRLLRTRTRIIWPFLKQRYKNYSFSRGRTTEHIQYTEGSVADPVPDPYVFGTSGYWSVSQKYGSGSFYHQAKIVRKTLIPNVLWLFSDFLSLKNDVCEPSKSNKQKNLEKLVFCWRLEGQWRK